MPNAGLKQELETAIKDKVPGVPVESRLVALADTAKVDGLERQLAEAMARLGDGAGRAAE